MYIYIYWMTHVGMGHPSLAPLLSPQRHDLWHSACTLKDFSSVGLWGFPSMGVPPIAGWFIVEKCWKYHSRGWWLGGTPISGNLHMASFEDRVPVHPILDNHVPFQNCRLYTSTYTILLPPHHLSNQFCHVWSKFKICLIPSKSRNFNS